MNKRALLLAANLTISAAGAGMVGLSVYKDHQASEAREARVRQLVERFHGCPERFQADRECFTPDERTRMLLSAEEAEGQGRFEEAGRTYIRLMRSADNDLMEAKAREMAGRCPPETRRDLNEEMTVRLEAIRRGAQEVRAAAAQAPAPDAGIRQGEPSRTAQETADAGAPQGAQTVAITVRTQPSGVEVVRVSESSIQVLCTSDPGCQLSMPMGSEPVELIFRKSGYTSRNQTVVPDQARTMDVTLEAEARRPEPPQRTAPRRSAPPRESAPRAQPQPQPQPQNPPNATVISSPD